MNAFWINGLNNLTGTYCTEVLYGYMTDDVSSMISNRINTMHISCSGPSIIEGTNTTIPGQITQVDSNCSVQPSSITKPGSIMLTCVPIGELSLTIPCNFSETKIIESNKLHVLELDQSLYQVANEFIDKYEVKWWRYDKIEGGGRSEYITGLLGGKHTITIQVRQKDISLIFFKGIIANIFHIRSIEAPKSKEVKFWWFEYLPMIKHDLSDDVYKRIKEDRLIIEREIFRDQT